jgi:hypothetical protein
MSVRPWGALVIMLAMSLTLVACTGCSSKSESKPNPEFQVPDIPPGKRDMPGASGKKKP